MPGEFTTVETGHIEWCSDSSNPYTTGTDYVDFELLRDNSLEIFMVGKSPRDDYSTAKVKIPSQDVPTFVVGLQAWIENLQKGDKS